MLKVIAHIHAKPGHEDELRAGLEELVAPTRAEKGCVQYDLFRDSEDPCHFIFDEMWESHELWRAHINSDHIKAGSEKTGALRERTTIYQGHQIL